jgi:LmbE family N-acetylglucosaminyl deacetylase
VTQPVAQPTTATTSEPPADHRVLLVTAHPDDVDFGAAGTVARWTSEGWTVTYCICTDGDAGGFDPAVPRSEIGGIRRAEQRAAAAEIGVRDVRFLGYPDGALEVSPALVRDIVRVIRDVRPQRVVMQSPERDWTRIGRSHPDHLTAGEATIRAIYPAARNPFAFPELLAEEGLDAWTVRETWVAGHPHPPDRFIDITDTFDRKIAALRRHASQTGHMDTLDELLRGWATRMAGLGGLPDGRLAEAFNVYETG